MLDHAVITSRPINLRSKVTNGTRMLIGVDGRSADARRYRDLIISLADDLGGEAKLTEAERALVRQAAAMTMQVERQQAAIVRGETVDVEQLVRVSNSHARILRRLVIKAKTPRPSIRDRLLARRQAVQA